MAGGSGRAVSTCRRPPFAHLSYLLIMVIFKLAFGCMNTEGNLAVDFPIIQA